MTIRLAISVEGPTELEFCREVLRPHFLEHEIDLVPIVIETKRILDGPNKKGGAVTIKRVVSEIRRLLSSFDHVSTLYDFYGFVGRKQNETADQLCVRISEVLDRPEKFIPYVQVYEFESLIFAEPTLVGHYLKSSELAIELSRAVDTCGGAERVNDGPNTAPSKRLTEAFSRYLRTKYDKKFHGPLMALAIGLPKMRAACPRFDAWIASLEALQGH